MAEKTTEALNADLRHEIQELRTDLTALGATVRDLGVTQVRATASEIEEMVARRPIAAVVVALAAGYFLAKLSR